MKALNLYDTQDKKHLSVAPTSEHTLPGTSDLLAFEAFDERVKDFHPDRLTLSDFKVVQHAGYIVGARDTLRAPRGIYLNMDVFLERLFPNFRKTLTHPVILRRHPLIHLIPEGVPGAGMIVVKDIAQLRSGGEAWGELSFIERQARERPALLRVLTELGFEVQGDDSET